ncbi:transmembrane protein [Rhynchospora pubera]|uniref:Transmembrane protein n=1 Tax=Rhynchospora pubera TaxID=906938 RepID=A0AAV8D6F3_9POAL|nr:transmembrane protein [Rhynchospora pubera]
MPFDCQMGHSRVALALSLLFILCGLYTTLSLPFLCFLALLFSSSFSFFQRSKHLMDSKEKISTQNEVTVKNEESQEEKPEKEVVQTSVISKEGEQDVMSNCFPVKPDLPQLDLQEFSSECSTESISDSDDESLIEISLPDGNHVEEHSEPVSEEESNGEFSWDFLPESVFKQSGLMELLSEINEEDNMIELDIARGSIKCSRLGIMA